MKYCRAAKIKMRIFSTENEDFDTKMRNFNGSCNNCLKTFKNEYCSFLLSVASFIYDLSTCIDL